ncbi:MAG: DPP IV N-terminal domain-containing protein [Henriciella sp.]|uniref:S9 family peptidase n=1 Tax=Henriciella sp. TaxID=1968823 RepID=UPI003C710AF2
MKLRVLKLAALWSFLTVGTGHLIAQESSDLPVNEFTLERLYASPSLNGPSPAGVKYSPDGSRVTFLKARESDSSRYDLWQFDVVTGEQSMLVDSTLLQPEEVELSEEEKALRERKRIAGRKGIVDYDWGTADTILVPLGGDLHLVTLGQDGPQTRQLTETDAFEYDAKVSPRGNYVSFVRDGAVFVIDLATDAERQVTPDAEPEKAISYGVAEFVAQEEMSRYTGYWWSPDERYIAYTRVDESTVDIIPRFDIAAEEVTVIEQRYPRAGRPNAIVDLFVRDMDTGEASQVDWRMEDFGPATDQYLVRVNWTGERLTYQLMGRDQSIKRWRSVAAPDWSDPINLSVEHHGNWINLSNDLATIGDRIVFTSEDGGGFRHISTFTTDGDSSELVTGGDWAVSAIEGIDRDNNLVFFTGFMDTPLEKHLYAQRIVSQSYDKCPACANYQSADGPPPVRLTQPGKSWSVTMAPDGASYVATSSAPDQPPQTGLYRVSVQEGEPRFTPDYDDNPAATLVVPLPLLNVSAERIAWIEENALDESHPYFPYLEDHTVPDYGTLEAEDGQTLYYSIQTPPDFDPSKKYPVIIEVYGGPHVQTVDRDWGSQSDQYLTRQGYIVFRLDNRGSYNRGKRFEDVIFKQTGGPEVRDQLAGVDWLKSQPFVDPDRIAIQGWSYGGYMALMTILQAPEGTFAAAAAGAPVTDWSLYDTFYTERYMRTPQDNPEGYEKSSVFYHLDRLNHDMPPLLLMHGMADDNVTFDNTTRLMAAMQEDGRTFELMTYPGQRHGIRGQALQTHLMRTRMAFLKRHLKPDRPE